MFGCGARHASTRSRPPGMTLSGNNHSPSTRLTLSANTPLIPLSNLTRFVASHYFIMSLSRTRLPTNTDYCEAAARESSHSSESFYHRDTRPASQAVLVARTILAPLCLGAPSHCQPKPCNVQRARLKSTPHAGRRLQPFPPPGPAVNNLRSIFASLLNLVGRDWPCPTPRQLRLRLALMAFYTI